MGQMSTPVTEQPAFRVTPVVDQHAPGAWACFPYDRALVRGFRAAFPRARWRDEIGCWFVPGVRAARRLNRWMARELVEDRHADERGRDAWRFEPLPPSPYLDPSGGELVIRTPYARAAVEILRAIPWARWDAEARVWRVPWRSYEALARRWPELEMAAKRAEPGARRQRAAARRADPEVRAAVLERERERRLRRFPVPVTDPPPPDRPVATEPWGVVVFEDQGSGPPARADAVPAFYTHAAGPDAMEGGWIWARWRQPAWRELASVRPASPDPLGARRGWWPPTGPELEARRETLRRVYRTRASPQRPKAVSPTSVSR